MTTYGPVSVAGLKVLAEPAGARNGLTQAVRLNNARVVARAKAMDITILIKPVYACAACLRKEFHARVRGEFASLVKLWEGALV
jgi:hypothetical protein